MEEAMESGELISMIAVFVLIAATAVAAYWLMSGKFSTKGRPATDSAPRIDDPLWRKDQEPEWKRIVRGEEDL